MSSRPKPEGDSAAAPPLAADELEAIHCLEVASWLNLAGTGPSRYCPKCQREERKQAPALRVGLTSFACQQCSARGDGVALVQLVLGQAPHQARQWLAEKARQEGSGIATSGDFQAALNDEGSPHAPIYQAFWEACPALSLKALDVLSGMGIPAPIVRRLGLRFCPDDLPALMAGLQQRFGGDALSACGLLAAAGGSDPLVPDAPPPACCFAAYHQARVAYLIIPYYQGGEVVALRGQALLGTRRLQERQLPATLGTHRQSPCLYNAERLGPSETIYLLRRELDAAVALSLGLAACAWADGDVFTPAWAAIFAGKQVIWVQDAGAEDAKALLSMNGAFDAAGLARPKLLPVPAGTRLAAFLRQRPQPQNQLGSSSDSSIFAAVASDVQSDEPLGETRFIASVQISETRLLTLHNFEHRGRPFVLCRSWLRNDQDQWRQAQSQSLVVPRARLDPLIFALNAAARGEQASSRPAGT